MQEKILCSDRDLMFCDWGIDSVFRVVEQRFVEESQVVEETFTDCQLSCLVGRDVDEQTFATAGQHLTEMIRVAFKTEELPVVGDWSVCRVVLSGYEYQVIGSKQSDSVVEFEGRRMKTDG